MEPFHFHGVLIKIRLSQKVSPFSEPTPSSSVPKTNIFGNWFRFSVQMKESVRRHIIICIRQSQLFCVSAYMWLQKQIFLKRRIQKVHHKNSGNAHKYVKITTKKEVENNNKERQERPVIHTQTYITHLPRESSKPVKQIIK